MAKRSQPIRVYLSYAFSDLERVRPIVRALRFSNLDVVDPLESVLPGDLVAEKLAELVRSSNGMVIFLTRAASKSPLLRSEWIHALVQGRFAHRVVVVPLDGASHADVPWGLGLIKWLNVCAGDPPGEVAERIAESLSFAGTRRRAQDDAA